MLRSGLLVWSALFFSVALVGCGPETAGSGNDTVGSANVDVEADSTGSIDDAADSATGGDAVTGDTVGLDVAADVANDAQADVGTQADAVADTQSDAVADSLSDAVADVTADVPDTAVAQDIGDVSVADVGADSALDAAEDVSSGTPLVNDHLTVWMDGDDDATFTLDDGTTQGRTTTDVTLWLNKSKVVDVSPGFDEVTPSYRPTRILKGNRHRVRFGYNPNQINLMYGQPWLNGKRAVTAAAMTTFAVIQVNTYPATMPVNPVFAASIWMDMSTTKYGLVTASPQDIATYGDNTGPKQVQTTLGKDLALVTGYRDAGSLHVQVNNNADVTSSTQGTMKMSGTGKLVMGNTSFGAVLWDVEICEILIYDSVLTADEIAVNKAYLKKKWGTP